MSIVKEKVLEFVSDLNIFLVDCNGFQSMLELGLESMGRGGVPGD